MARPFAAPPGIPRDRAAALIAAFDATMKDPDYLADAKKSRIDVNPVSGAGDRQAARRALCHAQGRDHQGQPGDREVRTDDFADRSARQPRRGPAAAARRAPLHRRHRGAGRAARRLRAQPASACRDPRRREGRGAGAAGRARRAHPRRPRAGDGQAPHDAALEFRHAARPHVVLRARRRRGVLRGRAGGDRDRRQPLHRRGRRRAGRRRLRPPARGRPTAARRSRPARRRCAASSTPTPSPPTR